MYLTPVHQKALDDSPRRPPRVIDPGTQESFVLLREDDFDWIRGLLADEPDAPRLVDARSQVRYALLPTDRYERFKSFFEEDLPTAAERQAQLRAFGKRAGWNDAPMDLYDDAQPPREP
jgi:hypothetical protein